MKVAVTGVGGGVGQSVMKALYLSVLPVEVYAIDVQPFSAGLFRAPNAVVLPRPELPGALDQWEPWLKEQGIEALIPGSDHDLPALASVKEDWAARSVCRVLISDVELVNTGSDKALTCQVLEAHGLPFPKSKWGSSVDDAAIWAAEIGFPVMLKPRDGFASRHVHQIKNEEELRFFFPRTPNPIVQEYLSRNGEVEEFTCAVFVDRDGEPIGTFMARRDLSAGATYRAEINVWPEIHELLLAIGRALRPTGPLNVQLRLTERGPVPFELNVRCSGTSAIRAYYGYNEAEMLLEHYVSGKPLSAPTVRSGYVLRYWNEIFLENVGRAQLEVGPQNLQGKVLPWP